MSWRHRLGVYYGVRDDESLASEWRRSSFFRPWRLGAFLGGLLLLLGIPTLILIPLLGRSFTAHDVGRTALGVLAAVIVLIWLVPIGKWAAERTRKRGSHT